MDEMEEIMPERVAIMSARNRHTVNLRFPEEG
jgi:hypothetical protein